jgi:hypothetical protein
MGFAQPRAMKILRDAGWKARLREQCALKLSVTGYSCVAHTSPQANTTVSCSRYAGKQGVAFVLFDSAGHLSFVGHGQ